MPDGWPSTAWLVDDVLPPLSQFPEVRHGDELLVPEGLVNGVFQFIEFIPVQLAMQFVQGFRVVGVSVKMLQAARAVGVDKDTADSKRNPTVRTF